MSDDLLIKIRKLLDQVSECDRPTFGGRRKTPSFREKAEHLRSIADDVRKQIVRDRSDRELLLSQASECRLLAGTLSDTVLRA